jgi:5-amino-6-(5-phosphoribosylamino)uracil reductase/diaminohydroxyphosphoribosylaminopyrimidine deaminase/5-amino-6-(5-phosphoribosylamino)uracil reductase
MKRPNVTLVYAQSLDGRIALARSRTSLSSDAGLALAHRYRAENDAVLVGSSTLKIDNPQLTVRFAVGKQPKRIILSSRLDVPLNARVFVDAPGVLVVGALGLADDEHVQALRERGADVRLVAARPDGTVTLSEALTAISDWGVTRLLVEGGARVLSSFIRERLVDQVVVDLVPVFLGETGVHCVGDLAVQSYADCPNLTDVSVERIGASVFIRGTLSKSVP